MSDTVVKFVPQFVGEAFRFDPDVILEQAKGQNFDRLVILGEDEAGEIYIAGSANAGESLILMERAKFKLIGGSIDG